MTAKPGLAVELHQHLYGDSNQGSIMTAEPGSAVILSTQSEHNFIIIIINYEIIDISVHYFTYYGFGCALLYSL